jgi:hypothetical protein
MNVQTGYLIGNVESMRKGCEGKAEVSLRLLPVCWPGLRWGKRGGVEQNADRGIASVDGREFRLAVVVEIGDYQLHRIDTNTKLSRGPGKCRHRSLAAPEHGMA